MPPATLPGRPHRTRARRGQDQRHRSSHASDPRRTVVGGHAGAARNTDGYRRNSPGHASRMGPPIPHRGPRRTHGDRRRSMASSSSTRWSDRASPCCSSAPSSPTGSCRSLVGTGARRSVPADPLPQAGLGRQHPHRGASERRGPRRRRCGTPRSPRGAACARRGPLQRWGGCGPACARRPRAGRDAHPARALAAPGAQHRGVLRAGRTRVRGLRERRPRDGARHLHERRRRHSTGPRAERCSTSVSQAPWPRPSRTRTPSSVSSCPPWPSGCSGREDAAAIRQPVLSVLGADTQPVWVETAGFLRSALPQVEECTIDGVGHLLHIQRPEPVARAVSAFLGRHPIASD